MTKLSRTATALALVFACAFSNPTIAAQGSCYGTLAHLGIDSGGNVTVQLGTSTPVHRICSLVGPVAYSAFDPKACAAAYGVLVTAKSLNKSVAIYYNDFLGCGAIPSWGNTNVYFIEGPY